MKRMFWVVLCVGLFGIRWVTLPNPLPNDWGPESKVGYSETILDKPEYTDSRTIVRSGIWYISILGYKEIIPGSRVRFVGSVEPQMMMGKVTRVIMRDPKIEIIRSNPEQEHRILRIRVMMGQWREKWVGIFQYTLPEPMASLAAGILLGIKSQIPREFYDDLVSTGTLHIVAASGYNVSIVAEVLMKVVGGVVSRGVAIGLGILGIITYVVIAGSSAAVVRAGIMGSLTLIAYYFGRPAEARRLLWVAAGSMLMWNPLILVDTGFELSVAATMGILYIGPWLKTLDDRIRMPASVRGFMGNYLYPTLAATLATLPIILWHFGRVSWISPLVNVLILPLVPLIMLLSALTLVLGQPVAWLLYPPLVWVGWIIQVFGKLIDRNI